MSVLTNLLPFILICFTIIIIFIYTIKIIHKNKIIIRFGSPYTEGHYTTVMTSIHQTVHSYYNVFIEPKLVHLESLKFDKDGKLNKEYQNKIRDILKEEVAKFIGTFLSKNLMSQINYYFNDESLGIYIYNEFNSMNNVSTK